MEEERPSEEILYSPSQVPKNFDSVEMVKSKMEELHRQNCIFVTVTKLEEGVLVEPPEPSFELTAQDFKGNEMDPVIYQAAQTFMSDNSFIKSRAFLQFLWKRNFVAFEAKCKKLKVEQPHLEDSIIKHQIKEDLL